MSRFIRRSPRSAVLRSALVVAGSLACRNDVVAPTPAVEPDALYWSLTLNHRAVTLSTTVPHNMIALTAIARNGLGDPLTGVPAPTFTSSDLQRVFVDEQGVVRAVSPGTSVKVVAQLRVNNVTHTDTAYINVVDDADPPVLASFSANPEAPDSSKEAVGGDPLFGFKQLQARAFDAEGQPIVGLPVYFSTSDSKIAKIDPLNGTIEAIRPGQVTFYATTTAFGMRMVDTIPFTVGYPLWRLVNIVPTLQSAAVNEFDMGQVRIGVGGVVVWNNMTGVMTDVTFDDASVAGEHPLFCAFVGLCGSGNVEPYAPPPGDPNRVTYFRARQFLVPGEYRYHSTISGAAATVIVVDERAGVPALARGTR